MDNREIWDALRTPPAAAIKPIAAGRLKGKSDINPQWRYEAMTEQFGPCGIGWRFELVNTWREDGSDGQIFAFAKVHLFIKVDGEWSAAIPATGGSMLVQMESKGLHSSDEGYKMATTDALGTAMKMVGLASDIYRGGGDSTKYERKATQEENPTQKKTPTKTESKQQSKSTVSAKESAVKACSAFTTEEIDSYIAANSGGEAKTFADLKTDEQFRWLAGKAYGADVNTWLSAQVPQ